jgi:hypothetical protein
MSTDRYRSVVKVTNEVRDRIQLSENDIGSSLIENVHERAARIDITESERQKAHRRGIHIGIAPQKAEHHQRPVRVVTI